MSEASAQYFAIIYNGQLPDTQGIMNNYELFLETVDRMFGDQQAPRRQQAITVYSTPTGSSPMDLDSMSVRRIPNEERQYRMDNKLCLYCGGAGHRVANCPIKKPIQANTIFENQGNDGGRDLTGEWILDQVYAQSDPCLHLTLPVRIISCNLSSIPIQVLIDSGSQRSSVDARFIKNHRLTICSLMLAPGCQVYTRVSFVVAPLNAPWVFCQLCDIRHQLFVATNLAQLSSQATRHITKSTPLFPPFLLTFLSASKIFFAHSFVVLLGHSYGWYDDPNRPAIQDRTHFRQRIDSKSERVPVSH